MAPTNLMHAFTLNYHQYVNTAVDLGASRRRRMSLNSVLETAAEPARTHNSVLSDSYRGKKEPASDFRSTKYAVRNLGKGQNGNEPHGGEV